MKVSVKSRLVPFCRYSPRLGFFPYSSFPLALFYEWLSCVLYTYGTVFSLKHRLTGSLEGVTLFPLSLFLLSYIDSRNRIRSLIVSKTHPPLNTFRLPYTNSLPFNNPKMDTRLESHTLFRREDASVARGNRALVVTAVLTALSILVVAMRVYARMALIKMMGREDWTIVISLVSLVRRSEDAGHMLTEGVSRYLLLSILGSLLVVSSIDSPRNVSDVLTIR